MYYRIVNNQIQQTNSKDWEDCAAGIAIFDSEEWGEYLHLQKEFSLTKKKDDIFFCRLEGHNSYFFGIFHIPIKKRVKRHDTFAVYILKGKLIFIDDEKLVEEKINRISGRIVQDSYTLERFLYDFLMSLIEEDILYLAELERDIAEMEESVLEGETERFNYKMLTIKKEISRLYCYYSQLTDIGESICENAKNLFDEEEISVCEIFSNRTERFQQEAQILREYAMQVQDVYQAEITIHQNDIMKVLTIVTTIFLPLTLVAGWYGMNFEQMPEIAWKYSYPVVTGVSILIVIVELWFFKKKKFF